MHLVDFSEDLKSYPGLRHLLLLSIFPEENIFFSLGMFASFTNENVKSLFL